MITCMLTECLPQLKYRWVNQLFNVEIYYEFVVCLTVFLVCSHCQEVKVALFRPFGALEMNSLPMLHIFNIINLILQVCFLECKVFFCIMTSALKYCLMLHMPNNNSRSHIT